MAVIINGSGTVTGLAVGGLPDVAIPDSSNKYDWNEATTNWVEVV
jgi:hypothetical protein